MKSKIILDFYTKKLYNINMNANENILTEEFYEKSDLSLIGTHIEIKNETSLIKEIGEDITRIFSEDELISGMVEQEFVVRMSPKKKYKIQACVRNIKKGEPRIIEPDEYLIID